MKSEDLSPAEVKERFIDPWRSALQNSRERLSDALVQGRVSPDKVEEVKEVLVKQKMALDRISQIETLVSEFGDIVQDLADLSE